MSVDRAAYGRLAVELERSLRAVGAWNQPPPSSPVEGAFGAPELTFAQWLEHVLCPRLVAIAAGAEDPPSESHVSAQAAREFDGDDEADQIIDTLVKLDRLVEGNRGR